MEPPYNCRVKGRNQLRKYLRLRRIIGKKNKLLCKLRKRTHALVAPLKKETIELQEQLLQRDVHLGDMADRLLCAQQQIKQLSDASCELTASVRHNQVLVQLLLEDHINLDGDCAELLEGACSQPKDLEPTVPQAGTEMPARPTRPATASPDSSDFIQEETPLPITSNDVHQTIIYSDGMGKGFGYLLNNCLQQTVNNVCMPGASYSQIIDKIVSKDYNSYTTIVVIFGNSTGVQKHHIVSGCERLMQMKFKKLILCALPYVSQGKLNNNAHIYNLNLCMYNATYRHSDVIILDTNMFISNFTLTKDTMYLSNRYKKLLANLLAFNICDPSVVYTTLGDSVANSMSTSTINLN